VNNAGHGCRLVAGDIMKRKNQATIPSFVDRRRKPLPSESLHESDQGGNVGRRALPLALPWRHWVFGLPPRWPYAPASARLAVLGMGAYQSRRLVNGWQKVIDEA